MLVLLSSSFSFADALPISDVKLSGINIPPNFYAEIYTTSIIVSRATYEKNPVITFNINWEEIQNNIDMYSYSGGYLDILDPNLRFLAFIEVGSLDLRNIKNVDVGVETGSFKTVMADKYVYYPPFYEPYNSTTLKKGDYYLDYMTVTPSQKSYSYTIQNPEILSFDAHTYSIDIEVIACDKAYETYLYKDDFLEWYDATGDNSDDAGSGIWGTIYEIRQEINVNQDYRMNSLTLRLRRHGILPANYRLIISITEEDGKELWSSENLIPYGYELNGTVLNAYMPIQDFSYDVGFPSLTPYSYPSVPITQTGVPLKKDRSYYIWVRANDLGDIDHKIIWRKDTSFAVPHYSIGFLTYCWSRAKNSGGAWVRMPDTYMFDTGGYFSTKEVVKGNEQLSFDSGYWHSFVLNTYGNSIDKISYDATTGWWQTLQYVYNRRNSDNGVTCLFFGKATPAHMDVQAGDCIGIGATFDTASMHNTRATIDGSYLLDVGYVDTKTSIYYVLCDRDRKVLNYGNMNSYMPIVSTLDVDIVDKNYKYNQFKLLFYTIGKDVIENNQAYYLYIGVKPPYNCSNTYITVDDTLKAVNWSLDKMEKGYLVSPDDTYDVDFMGAYAYFETNPAYVDTYSPGNFRSTPAVITNFIIWCNLPPPNGAGLPWLPVLFGFLPAIIIVGLLYSFARKFEISIPQFIYVLAMSGGLFITWSIGLLSLWIFVFMVSGLVLVSIYSFREPINKALKILTPSKRSISTVKATTEKTYKYPLKQARLPAKVDQGVAPQHISRKPRIATTQTSLRRPPLESELPAYGGLMYTPKKAGSYYKKKIDKGG